MKRSWELCISIQNNIFRLAVCRYNKKNKKIEMSRAIQLDVPQEFNETKNASSAGAVTGLIRRVLKDNKINLKRYSLCISDRTIITRVIKLPRMELKDLKNFMKLSIQQYFPIKGEDYCFDFTIQSINEKDDKNYYNLLLVAIPKQIINYYTGILLKCGLKPTVINIYSNAVSNLFLKLEGKDVAVMDIGYNYTEFIMLESKSIFINSIINYAIPKNEEDISEEVYLKNLEGNTLGEDFITIAETLKNYLNFFSTRHHGKSVEEIYFIGEGAMLREAIFFIEDNLNVKIKNGHDLLSTRISTLAMPSSMKRDFQPERFCSCLGLIAGRIEK